MGPLSYVSDSTARNASAARAPPGALLTTVGAATALAAIFWFWAPVLELPNNIDTFTAALQQISRVNSWSRPRECRSLSHFSNAGKQTKPICFPGKGRSGLRGEAFIRCRTLVGGSNL